MSLSVDIYGTLVETPEKPAFFDIENWGTDDPQEQYWRRRELPDFFDQVEYDKQGNLLLTAKQEEYASREVERCKKGFYFMSNGRVRYITGKHYFYLQWWKLEDDIYPDYRDADRKYFLFLNHWERVLWCLGILRAKKRREGASSQATSNLIYECIFYKNSFCGLVSKSNKDSRDTFTDMVAFGYRQLPPFLQPKQLNDKDSVTELVFAHKSTEVKGGKANSLHGEGHRSRVNYMAPAINAYDRGRLSRILGDEGGKFPPEVPFSKWLSIVSKCLVKGAKRVGFGEFPSTINELTRHGGAQYKIAWDNANQFKNPAKPTTNFFVRYFSPAYEGYEGFVDKYGESVVDAPTEEQLAYLVDRWVGNSALTEDDIRLGAKQYLLTRREGLTGDLLEEEMRQNPFNEEEAFMAALTDCPFSLANINKRLKELAEAPVYKRKILFYRNIDTGKVAWRDINKNEENFHWKIGPNGLPPEGEDNKFQWDGRLKKPGRIHVGAITVDSYSNSQGGRKYGSKASAWMGLKHDPLNPYNTGKAVGWLYGRPPEKDILHEQVMLAAEYCGFKIWYEHTADDYDGYFRERGKIGYLGTYPVSTLDPTKREHAERHRGFPTTPFSLTIQLDAGISYFLHHCDQIDWEELLETAKVFDPYDRTAYDAVVSFLMLIVVLTEPMKPPPPRRTPIVKLYENSNYS